MPCCPLVTAAAFLLLVQACFPAAGMVTKLSCPQGHGRWCTTGQTYIHHMPTRQVGPPADKPFQSLLRVSPLLLMNSCSPSGDFPVCRRSAQGDPLDTEVSLPPPCYLSRRRCCFHCMHTGKRQPTVRQVHQGGPSVRDTCTRTRHARTCRCMCWHASRLYGTDSISSRGLDWAFRVAVHRTTVLVSCSGAPPVSLACLFGTASTCMPVARLGILGGAFWQCCCPARALLLAASP